MKKIVISTLFLFSLLGATESQDLIIRDNWNVNQSSIAETALPSNIKYIKHYENLPSEISMSLFNKKDLSAYANKKLFVGYGIIDNNGDDCRLFPKEVTGYNQDTTICLPFWRMEREYEITSSPIDTFSATIDLLPTPKPPIKVDVCDAYSDDKQYPGGKTTCVTYYDKLAGDDCYDNPRQEKCFVSTCTTNMKEHCEFKDVVIGNETNLSTAISTIGSSAPIEAVTRVDLSTIQYNCPAGPIMENVTCVDNNEVLMFPAECEVDNPNTPEDDSVYEYCDKNANIRDASDQIIKFTGTCKNGKSIECETKQFSMTNHVCVEPIYEDINEVKTESRILTRSYRDYQVDWISGEQDMYSQRDECLRTNNILEGREQELYVNILANGALDDDVYMLRHKPDGDHVKIYCNMQHAPTGAGASAVIKQCLTSKTLPDSTSDVEKISACGFAPDNTTIDYFAQCLVLKDVNITSSQDVERANECINEARVGDATKAYNGSLLQCIRNNGSYSVNAQSVPIDISDIITIQQNSEQESTNSTPFAVGRNHYGSTKVQLNGKTITPQALGSDYPYYPKNGPWLRAWDNVTATLTILFPFSGVYELYFYNSDGEEVLKKVINPTHFSEISNEGFAQLLLGKDMKLAGGIADSNAIRLDDWTEWGGGVYGGKASKTGNVVAAPNDAYVKKNAITSIIVKDLLLGQITPIPMVYPMAYPNRIFISKLDVYEKRKYRCYDNFGTPADVGETETKYVCSTDQNWLNYKLNSNADISGVDFWMNNEICEQNCRSREACIPSGNKYLCQMNGYQSESQSECGTACYAQNVCETHSESSCSITKQDVLNPVSDFTGKTVFTLGETTYACNDEKRQLVGCARYETKTIAGAMDFQLGNVGVEKLNPLPFEDAITKANMLDMPAHLWSGWEGECMDGMKLDTSFLSDPMTIMGYCMMAYQSYTQINGQSLFDEMSKSYSSFTETTTKSTVTSVTKDAATGAETIVTETTTGVAGSAGSVAGNGSSSFIKSAMDVVNTPIYTSTYVNITVGSLATFGVNAVATLAAPDEDEYEKAQELLSGLNGTTSSSIVAYNSCMASIGLSMPNLISWSFQDTNTTSIELLEPWKNPINMTPEQIATIASIYGEDWVMASYRMDASNPTLLNIIAITPDAYITAGKTVCAGSKVAAAMDQILSTQFPQTPPAPSGQGSKSLEIGLSAISAINPVAGFVAAVAMDLYTNVLAEVDTCKSQEDAMAKDVLHYKTNLFFNHDQCHDIETKCTGETFWGDCVQWTHYKCCYDMILTKVFAEGIKTQLGKDWSSCNDLTINDLKDISFKPCAAEENPQQDKCFPLDNYSEFKQVLFQQAAKNMQGSTQGLINQVTDSMAVPH